MSCDESENSSLSGQVTPPESTTLSSSRTSSSSNFGENGTTEGVVNSLASPPLTAHSASQLRNACDAQPQPEPDGSDLLMSPDGSGVGTPDVVDAQIIEALKSKDRLFVLKLGEQMEALIKEQYSRTRIRLSPENQYQRLLVHRCAQYYKLTPDNETKTTHKEMTVLVTLESRIPSQRISELVPAEQQPQAAFKIMRRVEQDRRRQKSAASRAGSIAGEDGDVSDPGPSEAGSMGSRSTTSKKHMTIAEREAAYQAARSRIFMGFEEKPAKDRDNAFSSTFSLISASGSGSQSGGAGGSAASDDDNASSAPTESEWSVAGTDRRRGGDSGVSSAGSTRSFRASTLPYNASGYGSGRASGTASPAITYPSLYDQSGHANGYEQATYPAPPGAYMAAPYPMYAYAPPPHTPGHVGGPAPYMAAYPMYPPQYHYGPPPIQPHHPASDPSSPSMGPVDGYHRQAMSFVNPHPYGWPPPPAHPQQSPETHSPPAPGPQQILSPPIQGPPPASAPYPPAHYSYMTPPYPGYPNYFQPPPPQPQPLLIHANSQTAHSLEHPPTNCYPPDHSVQSHPSNGNGSPSPTLSRHSNNSGGSLNGMSANKRGAPPARSAWSYGPGVGLHASPAGAPIHFPSGNGGGEVVGPRLSSTVRRISGASAGSNGSRTPGDETASTASSSTSSSSSRRTFMSTPPKHPLPPRPDWAAGLKPQPTLHPTRNRHDSNSSRTMSPGARPHQQLHHHHPLPQQLEPIVLQSSTEFPPLISGAPADRRPTIVGGAWSNPISARTILSSNAVNTNQPNGATNGTAHMDHNGSGQGMNRSEEDDRTFERPPRKSNGELFNPKGGLQRPGQLHTQGSSSSPASSNNEKPGIDTERGEFIESAILVNKLSSLKLADQPNAGRTGPNAPVGTDQNDTAQKAPSPGKTGLMEGAARAATAVASADA